MTGNSEVILVLPAKRSPDHPLRRAGLDALLGGQPEKAEDCFRRCLALVEGSEATRAFVCLADALFDQGRYAEAEEYLDRALTLGDHSGSGQISMAELLLVTEANPRRALKLAEEGFLLVTRPERRAIFFDRVVSDGLRGAAYWGRRARILAQLGSETEARDAIAQSLILVEAAELNARQSKPPVELLTRLIVGRNRFVNGCALMIADAHWQIGLAFSAIGETGKAASHFRTTRDTDRMGRFRQLSEQELNRINAQG